VVLDLNTGDHIHLQGVSIVSTAAVSLVGGAAADVLLKLSNGASIVVADMSLAMWNNGAGWLV
jgi:hypothetical protein